MQGKLFIIMTSFSLFVWRQVEFQISSVKVTACLLTRGLKKKKKSSPSHFLRGLYGERLLCRKGKFKSLTGSSSGNRVNLH